MHTLLLICAGLALLALFALIGRFMEADVGKSALAFLPVWLVCSLANMYVGVTVAGYTVAEELPINLVIFCVPAAFAGLLWWRAQKPAGTS